MENLNRQGTTTPRYLPRINYISWYLGVSIAVFLFPFTALAEETIYSPVPCEFSITFPAAPALSRNCHENGECYDAAHYTQTFDSHKHMADFRVTCSAIGPDIAKRYDEDLMSATVRAMARRANVKNYETSFRSDESYKQAGLAGAAQTLDIPPNPKIYIAQLWVGESSSLSVEATLYGEDNIAADEVFSKILKSVGLKELETDPSDAP